MTRRVRIALLASVLAALGASAGAQCPDGSPPACRGASAIARRANPALNERAWIVVPFTNVMKAPDLDQAYDLAMHRTADLHIDQQYLDSLSRARGRSGTDEQLTSVLALDGALALGDSATALRIARFATDSVLPTMERQSASVGFGAGGDNLAGKWLLVPRIMLQRADLAAAAGARDEARTWYARVLDLLHDADPELQSEVARVRERSARVAP